MPPNEEAIVREMFAALNRGDPGALDYFDPDAELIQNPDLPDTGTFRGREKIQDGMRDFLSAWGEINFEPRELLVGSDGIFVAVYITGKGRGSGLETEAEYFHAYWFGGGRITRCQVFEERSDALSAAGARD